MRTVTVLILGTIGMHTENYLVQALSLTACFLITYYEIRNDKSVKQVLGQRDKDLSNTNK